MPIEPPKKKLERLAKQIVELDLQTLLQKGKLIREVKEVIDRAGGRTMGFTFDGWVEEIAGPRAKNPRRTMLNCLNAHLTFGKGGEFETDLETLGQFEQSALFDLAERRNTGDLRKKNPPAPGAIKEAIRRAKRGEKITRQLAQELIEKHTELRRTKSKRKQS